MYRQSSPRPIHLLSLLVLSGLLVLPLWSRPALATQGTGAVSPSSCAATPLRRTPFPGLVNIPWIMATPTSAGITGHLFFVGPGAHGADAELHTGGIMPDGASTKILWVIGHGNVDSSIVIDGRNLTGAGRTHQVFPVAGGGAVAGSQYPSIVVVLTPGCWQFRLRSGAVTGTVTLPVVAPAAVPAPLGPLSTTCPRNPPPTTINPAFGTAIGMRPAWAIGFSPGLALRMGNPQFITHGPHGWYVKILWVVAPGFYPRVTLRGSTAGGGAPLWFQIGDQAPSIAPILNPQAPPIPNQPPGWANFPSYLFIPQAGCYALEASWPGGTWRLTFAAGRSAALGGA